MTKVFIGGSRKIGRLRAEVRKRLDRIIEKKLQVLIGDANGADRAVQQYLDSRGYDRVEVFCMDGICRNNVGGWVKRSISAPKGAKGFEYYSAKDKEMTNESTVGFMLWDGKSKGTLTNVSRLIEQNKKVLVYVAPQRKFVTFSDRDAWMVFSHGALRDESRISRGRNHSDERPAMNRS
jgi:hypothetical protein